MEIENTEWSQLVGLVCDRHAKLSADVAAAIHQDAVPPQAINRWGVVCMVLGCSSRYADAAKLQLEAGLGPTAAQSIRTIFEYAGVLGYIASRQGQAEDFAELFGLSDALGRKKMAATLCSLSPQLANQMALVDGTCSKYRAKAVALAISGAKPTGSLPTRWNGMSIADTWGACELGLQYETWYRECCLFGHADAFGCLYGFGPEILGVGETDSHYWSRRFGVALSIALLCQLVFAKQLTGLQFDEGADTLERLLRAAMG